MEKDKKLQEILREREIPELNPNFEQIMMKRIYQVEPRRNKRWNHVWFINLFFTIGFLLGIAILVSIFKSNFTIHLFHFNIDRIYLQLPVVIAVLFFGGISYKATLYHQGRLSILEL